MISDRGGGRDEDFAQSAKNVLLRILNWTHYNNFIYLRLAYLNSIQLLLTKWINLLNELNISKLSIIESFNFFTLNIDWNSITYNADQLIYDIHMLKCLKFSLWEQVHMGRLLECLYDLPKICIWRNSLQFVLI